MSFGFAPVNARVAFLPTEFEVPPGNQEMRDAIGDRENLTANMLNIREISQYELVEVLTAQTWFSTKDQANVTQSQKTRYGYRRTFNLIEMNSGPIIVGTTTLRVTPSVQGIAIPTRAFGSGTISGPKYVFFPSSLVDITFDNTNTGLQTITIINNLASPMTQCYVTIEYLKQP